MRFLTLGVKTRVRVSDQKGIEFMRFRKHRFSGCEAANDGDIYQVSQLLTPQSTPLANRISLPETVALLQKSADQLDAYLADNSEADKKPSKTT